eukprot:TRINITY_DN1265_c0_g1_i4.p1 TRINITY_DN1265_c0_g1~~TRINITY_DN1265_c0_g1_i4.p1  ORF type:complete len:288 (+),score=40.27 TRINITY_DN1265_c0_g1_i4:213-1076(+)
MMSALPRTGPRSRTPTPPSNTPPSVSNWPPLDLGSAAPEPQTRPRSASDQTRRPIVGAIAEHKDLCTARSSPAEEDQLHVALSQAAEREQSLRQENQRLKEGLAEAVQELEEARNREANNLRVIAALRAEAAQHSREQVREDPVVGNRRDDAMREFFEMVCFSIKLKYGPFSNEKLVSSETTSEILYQQAMTEQVPMWDWPVWVEKSLTRTIAAPTVHVAKKLSRVCNWDGSSAPAAPIGGMGAPQGWPARAQGTLERDSEESSTREDGVIADLTQAAGDPGSGSLL